MQFIHLNFYNAKVVFASEDEELILNIKRDFSFFLKQDVHNADIKISSFNQSPPYEKIPEVRGRVYNASSVCYDDGKIRYVDYNGKALTIYDYEREEGKVYSEDNHLLHEITYLLILSRSGELLDKRGIHRVHALGFSFNDKGVLCLLPMGGGKTTLALELLKNERIKLISDDTPLISKKGLILPFPLRIGVGKDENLDIPSEYLREFKRREYEAKMLIDIDYFKDKIAEASYPSIILTGEREFSNEARILKMNKLSAFPAFIRNAIFGLGLPQLVEYFLKGGIKDLYSKMRIVLSRTVVCLKIIQKAKVYKFIMGRNTQTNTQTLLDFLHNE